MSRHDIPAKRPGFTVVVGWDNPMSTFFAQVEDKTAGEDDDPVVLWLGGRHHEVLRPEDLVAPLAPMPTSRPHTSSSSAPTAPVMPITAPPHCSASALILRG